MPPISELEKAAERLLAAKRRAVLLVEDTAAHAALIRRALDPAAWEVEHVTRGAQALASFAQDSNRIILLDLTLPDADGLGLLREFQKMSPGAAVIVVTAREEVPLTVQLMQAGAWNYVVKGESAGPKVRDALEQGWNRRMKEAEEDLIQQSRFAEMVRSERLNAIEVVVRTVCHEVNNPLSGVVALSQLLSRNEKLDGEMRKLADGIARSAQDVARVVDKLHSISDEPEEFGGQEVYSLGETPSPDLKE